jgi:hypothetical protein
MRHAITVVGSKEQLLGAPDIRLRDNDKLREVTWFAATKQERPLQLLDDSQSRLLALMRATLLAYRFYQYVHGIKLWSGKRPLILVHGRRLSSRVAAYAGTWGGGDVVKADLNDAVPLGPTRFVLAADGRLKLKED